MICDFHLHTKMSYDSDADIDEVICTAISKGMKYMAVTDHHDFDLEDCVFEQKNPKAYYDTINSYKEKYSKKIRLSVGIELGVEACQAKRLYDFTSQCPFDFIIGSIHGVDGLDPYYDNYWEGLTTKEGMEKYFDAIIDSLNVYNDFDVFGHIDYAIRYARNEAEKHYSYSDFSDRLDTILHKIISLGKGIEINTGGLRKGLKTTNPCEEIIKKYREYGGKIITVGSDAHTPSDIGADFDTAREILLRCGFSEYCVFEKRQPLFIKL